MQIKRLKLLVLLLSGLLSFFATASEVKPQPSCHRLMTEKECSDHLARLATLQPGEALDRYMAEYTSRQKDREAACLCSQAKTIGATTPPQMQALLLF